MSEIDLRRYGWAPGNYMFKCIDCTTPQTRFIDYPFGDKRAIRCEECAMAMMRREQSETPLFPSVEISPSPEPTDEGRGG